MPRPPARAAERDVDVVAEPGRQRDVPAPPEVGRAAREIRMVEVLGQLEPEPARRAARDVGVGGEVRVDLDREGEHAGPEDVERRIRQREDLVGDHADVVGDDELLEEAPADQDEAAARLLGREAARRLDLRQQERRALNRARRRGAGRTRRTRRDRAGCGGRAARRDRRRSCSSSPGTCRTRCRPAGGCAASGSWTASADVASTPATFSTKKLKYLKKPSMPKFEMTLSHEEAPAMPRPAPPCRARRSSR